MSKKVARDVWGVTSELEQKLLRIEHQAKQQREETANQLIETAENEVQSFPEMDKYNLKEKDKVQYMVSVKPQLKNIQEMVEAGMPTTKIAEVLAVPYAGLQRMRKEIPELEYVFQLGEQTKVELAQEAMFKLAQYDVIEEQVVTREGEIVTIQKVEKPDFRASKFILENHMKDTYSNEQKIVHTSAVNEELQNVLDQMSPELLDEVLKRAQAIEVEADITEEVEIYGEED